MSNKPQDSEMRVSHYPTCELRFVERHVPVEWDKDNRPLASKIVRVLQQLWVPLDGGALEFWMDIPLVKDE